MRMERHRRYLTIYIPIKWRSLVEEITADRRQDIWKSINGRVSSRPESLVEKWSFPMLWHHAEMAWSLSQKNARWQLYCQLVQPITKLEIMCGTAGSGNMPVAHEPDNYEYQLLIRRNEMVLHQRTVLIRTIPGETGVWRCKYVESTLEKLLSGIGRYCWSVNTGFRGKNNRAKYRIGRQIGSAVM